MNLSRKSQQILLDCTCQILLAYFVSNFVLILRGDRTKSSVVRLAETSCTNHYPILKVPVNDITMKIPGKYLYYENTWDFHRLLPLIYSNGNRTCVNSTSDIAEGVHNNVLLLPPIRQLQHSQMHTGFSSGQRCFISFFSGSFSLHIVVNNALFIFFLLFSIRLSRNLYIEMRSINSFSCYIRMVIVLQL